MLPVGMFDVPVFSKYILGRSKKSDGSLIYGELHEEPKEAPTVTAASHQEEDEDFPRVEELQDEEPKPESTTD